MKVTENEKELIELIRLYRKSRHNYSSELEEMAIALFEKLMEEDESGVAR